MVDIEVGGSVRHEQKGAKTELGTSADHLVIYYDADQFDRSTVTIRKAIVLHDYAKKLKAGLIVDTPKAPEA